MSGLRALASRPLCVRVRVVHDDGGLLGIRVLWCGRLEKCSHTARRMGLNSGWWLGLLGELGHDICALGLCLCMCLCSAQYHDESSAASRIITWL